MSVSHLPVQSVRARSRVGARTVRAQKGQQTKQLIIDAALGLAEQIGLEGLSIGALAEVTHMSKSGVFAHFRLARRTADFRDS
jgi:AcrR family transcriptional regulator